MATATAKKKDLLKDVKEWSDKIGPRRAGVILLEAGVGLGTVLQLTGGRYPSKPRPLLEAALVRALTVQE